MNLEQLIPLFGERLKNAAGSTEKESFVRLAVIPLLKSRNRETIEWLVAVLEQDPPFWKSSSEHDRNTFAETLTTEYEGAADEMRPILARLGEICEVSVEED